MENEINKLKKLYLSKDVPDSLEKDGLVDLWTRVEKIHTPHRFYFSRMVITAVVIIVALTGFVGFAQAAKPGNVLYPVKIATQKVIANITHQTSQEVEKEINKVIPGNQPTTVPSPAITPLLKKKNNDSESEREQSELHNEDSKTLNKFEKESHWENQKNKNEIRTEDVKGILNEDKKMVPTQKPEQNQENNFQNEIKNLNRKIED